MSEKTTVTLNLSPRALVTLSSILEREIDNETYHMQQDLMCGGVETARYNRWKLHMRELKDIAGKLRQANRTRAAEARRVTGTKGEM